MGCNLVLRVAFCVLLAELAAGAEVHPLDTDFMTGDLGETAGVQDLLGEAESMYLHKEAGDYAGTKKKLEDELKKVEDDLKTKKEQAKKEYNEQLKKFSGTFSKLYSPNAGKEQHLASPLGLNGMGGMSEFAKQAYVMQVRSWSRKAHKKMEQIDIQLEENRYAHFSTAVCAEVLKSGVSAMGDMQWEAKRKKIIREIHAAKANLARHMLKDKADMETKLASYKMRATNIKNEIQGGFFDTDPKKVRLMNEGSQERTAAGEKGELDQAAHWAYAKQRTHNYEVYEDTVKKLKAKLHKYRQQHDLTLCRTGRKPQSPELKYRLEKEKEEKKKEEKKKEEKKKEEAKEEKKEEAKEEKKEEAKEEKKKEEAKEEEKKKEEAKEEKKKEEAKEEEKKEEEEEAAPAELGEGAATSARDPKLKNQLFYEFHRLIDASGGQESIAERAEMWKNLQNSERVREASLRKEFGLERKH